MNELKDYCLRIIDYLEKIVAGEDEECTSLYDYFEDVLSVEYTISGRGDFLGGRVAITLGGPNVWLNSRFGIIEGFWGSDSFSWSLPIEVAAELENILGEWYNCLL